MPGSLTLEFIGRSMDYVHRELELLEWSRNIVKQEDGKTPTEFQHVERSVDYLARFMEGSSTFEIFTLQELNRFVSDAVNAGAWKFIQGLQQYVFVAFDPREISAIAKALAFSISPNKEIDSEGSIMTSTSKATAQSPSGTESYDNTPDKILDYLLTNLWLMPLVALGMSRDIPTMGAEETNS